MSFTKKKAISPIIATLLLIAIAVAAGIIVYVFVSGLAGNLTAGGGQQTTERLQMQSSNFQVTVGTCSSGQILEVFFENTGSASTTISSVYLDGALLTMISPQTSGGGGTTFGNTNYFLVAASNIPTGCTPGTSNFSFTTATSLTEPIASGSVGELLICYTTANIPTSGTSHTVKIVSTTGATNVFSVTAGRSG